LKAEREEKMNFWIPACRDPMVFENHWMDMLLEEYPDTLVSLPMVMQGEIPLPIDLYPGQEGSCTGSRLLGLLCDLQFMKKELVVVRRQFDETVLEQAKALMGVKADNEKTYFLYRYFVHDLPHWYSALHSSLHPFVSDGPHGEEALLEIASTTYQELDSDTDSV
jgi:hypothetical protein